MELTIREEKDVFKPVTVSITLETAEELTSFLALFNVSGTEIYHHQYHNYGQKLSIEEIENLSSKVWHHLSRRFQL